MAIIAKTKEEIELMRKAALVVSRTLGMLASEVKPGVTTLYLDKLAEEYIRKAYGISRKDKNLVRTAINMINIASIKMELDQFDSAYLRASGRFLKYALSSQFLYYTHKNQTPTFQNMI